MLNPLKVVNDKDYCSPNVCRGVIRSRVKRDELLRRFEYTHDILLIKVSYLSTGENLERLVIPGRATPLFPSLRRHSRRDPSASWRLLLEKHKLIPYSITLENEITTSDDMDKVRRRR